MKKLNKPFHMLLKDFKLNEWFEAADGCEFCGAPYRVMVTHFCPECVKRLGIMEMIRK
jgi:hypothetical protein